MPVNYINLFTYRKFTSMMILCSDKLKSKLRNIIRVNEYSSYRVYKQIPESHCLPYWKKMCFWSIVLQFELKSRQCLLFIPFHTEIWCWNCINLDPRTLFPFFTFMMMLEKKVSQSKSILINIFFLLTVHFSVHLSISK